jgi:plastocyanin
VTLRRGEHDPVNLHTKGLAMLRTLALVAATAIAAVAASSAVAGSSVGVTIKHQLRGCHTWAVAGHAYAPSQNVKVAAGTSLTFTNIDVMPHTLVQLSGPKLALRAPKMGHMNARTTIVLKTPGVYKFKTVAGEDYPSAGEPKTIGEDNVLRLTVVVK